MVTAQDIYQLWVNWDEHIASTRPAAGFEAVTFFSRESYQTNLKILIQSGFRLL